MHICKCEYWLVQASHYSNKASEYVEWNEEHKEQTKNLQKKNRANLYAKNNRHFFTTRNNVLQADTVLNPGIPLFRTKTTSPRDTLVLALTSIYQFLSHLYHRGYSLCPCFSLSILSKIPQKEIKRKITDVRSIIEWIHPRRGHATEISWGQFTSFFVGWISGLARRTPWRSRPGNPAVGGGRASSITAKFPWIISWDYYVLMDIKYAVQYI